MNRHVLITGANRGLGYELLKVFHKNNYVVFPLIREIMPHFKELEKNLVKGVIQSKAILA
jgi:NAD(P)-dependent dehydrogenase (short-subunit alcohol dehydrogenase family)